MSTAFIAFTLLSAASLERGCAFVQPSTSPVATSLRMGLFDNFGGGGSGKNDLDEQVRRIVPYR